MSDDDAAAPATERALAQAILDLLEQRAAGATICPSEAARAVHTTSRPRDADAEGWRTLMEPARRAARSLVAEGRVEVTQRGEVVDPASARGPIRIRRVE